jgi:HlyD family secretion protein
MNRRRTMLREGAATLALLALCACDQDPHESLLGTLERDRLELVAEASEPIVTLRVREGDAVTAGQLLAELDPAAQLARLAAARAICDQAARRRDELARGPRIEQIQQARAQLAGAEAQRIAAEQEFARTAQLVAQHLVADSTLDARRADRDATAASARAARAQLAELERGTRIEQLDQAAAALAAAEADVRLLEVTAARLAIHAPRSGVVDALPYKQGERPPAGGPVVVMVADDQPFARVYVPEPLRARAMPGTAATIHVDGSDRDWHGRLRYIASEAAYTPYYALSQKDRSRLSYLAEIDLADPEARRLPTGVPVQVRLDPGAAP